jgi:quinol monooxygenase YgiN
MRDRSSGINSFECSQDNWDKNVFHFWERYESNTHLGRHNTSDEFKRFMEKVPTRPFVPGLLLRSFA